MRYSALLSGLFCVIALLAVQPAAAQDLWAALRSGAAVAIIRHAEAPGTGDPPGFRLDDCATQRNLSAAGRDYARRLGDAFRARGIASVILHSSAWCRCRDTATALNLGPLTVSAPLNSFFGRGDADGRQTAALRQLIAALPPGRPAVLVTHQVNISLLTGVYPASGEAIVLSRDGLTVLGRIGAGDL
jgi:phosphohistidine phosphatase SixA